MELRQLRYYVTLAKELNFSRAAEVLHISQPTLSQQIAELEGELGGPLFNRNKRSVTLTRTGDLLLDDAESVLYQFDQLYSRAKQYNSSERNTPVLVIGVDTNDHDLDRIDVIRAITDIHRSIPEAEFRITTVPFKSARVALTNHDIDVGFYTLPLGEEKHIQAPYKILKEDRIVLGVAESFFESNPGAELSVILKKLPLCLIAGDFRWNNYFVSVLQRYEKNLQTHTFDAEGPLFDFASAGLGFIMNTSTLFNINRKYPILPITIEEDDVRAVELVVWNEDRPNALRDALFDWIAQNGGK